MQEYYKGEYREQAKAQRKGVIILLVSIVALYILCSAGFMWWHSTLVIQSPTMTLVKAIHYVLTAIFVVAFFIVFGIKYRRVNKFYKKCIDMETGLTEENIGSFIEFDDTIQTKDGVEFTSAIFLEYKERKNDFYERKVLLFCDLPKPELRTGVNLRYVTQGNVLKCFKEEQEEKGE